MKWWKPNTWFLNEETNAFKNKNTRIVKQTDISGEGMEEAGGYGSMGLGSFNMFYNTYINREYKNEISKITNYRTMASNPEISDVVEDAVNESLQEDDKGNLLKLKIKDETIQNKKGVVESLEKEFNELFYNRLDVQDSLYDIMIDYFVDGRVFFENIINEKKKVDGIYRIKRLPPETMDFIRNRKSGEIEAFIQYKKINHQTKKPESVEEAKKDDNIILFWPTQITFIPYQFGRIGYNNIVGYLEKSKVPYNQLKLLETSMIIYRIVRAPERFVFKIDTGNMPQDRAMAYAEKVKKKMSRKESFDPDTGTLLTNSDVLCIRQNTEIKLLDGRCLPLTEVIKEFNEGKENWVYSINKETKKIEPGKIVNAKITRPNEKLVRVHLDDDQGSYIDTTYDHKFILRDGSNKRADELCSGDSLMPLYADYKKLGKLDYETVYDLKENKWETTHKMVCESTQRKRDYHEVIHHKNFNNRDNTPCNLKLMDKNDHLSLHAIVIKEMWENNYDEMCEKRKKQWEELKKDEEFMKEVSERTIFWNKELNKSEKLLESLNLPENRKKQKEGARISKTEYFKNPENRKKQSNQMKINQKNNPEAFDESRRKPKNDTHKKKISETLLKKWKDEDFREIHSKINGERYKNDPTLKKRLSNSQTIKIDDKLWGFIIKSYHELGKHSTLKEISEHLTNNFEFISHWAEINKNMKNVNKDKIISTGLLKIIKRKGYKGFSDFKENVRYNHKVLKVEYLDERDDTGCITVDQNHNFAVSFLSQPLVFIENSIMDNFFIPQGENRGSDIDTIGGSNIGFTELDDVFYFSRKLYRALKYPLSRVENRQEKRSGENLFQGSSFQEITRDEIKWAKFLERQQNKFSKALKNLFLIHLDFKNLKTKYGLNRYNIEIEFFPPNNYKEQMEQNIREVQFSNYLQLSNEQEFSKYSLMKRYLKWTDEDIKENADMKKKDKEMGLVPKEEEGGGGFGGF